MKKGITKSHRNLLINFSRINMVNRKWEAKLNVGFPKFILSMLVKKVKTADQTELFFI